jgi:transmembrane sensor
MSDHTAGPAPDDGAPAPDAAFDAMLARWVPQTPDPIDVEAALARVNAMRRAEATPERDDLARRRAARRDDPRTVPLWQRGGFRAAAAVLIVAGAAMLWQTTRIPAAESYVTTTGLAKEIRLADGTEVRLGPASSLQLDPGFGRTHRHLTLHGEAWFKVTHDATRPFAIRVGGTTVEDIGTAFLVRESASSEVSVRVAEGSVKVTRAAAARDSSVLLQAGDGAVATADGITVAAGTVTAAEGAALASGHLTFTDASLVEVQEALHRWYGVTLVLADTTLRTRHVTADFTGEPVSRVAAVLGLTLGVTAEARGDTIELHGAAEVPSRP